MILNEKFLFQQTELRACFLPGNVSKLNFESLHLYCSMEGIPSCFLFRGMVRARNANPRVCFYFCSAVRSPERFSIPRNGLKRISGVFFLRKILSDKPFVSSIPSSAELFFCWKFVENSQPYAHPRPFLQQASGQNLKTT